MCGATKEVKEVTNRVMGDIVLVTLIVMGELTYLGVLKAHLGEKVIIEWVTMGRMGATLMQATPMQATPMKGMETMMEKMPNQEMEETVMMRVNIKMRKHTL